MIPKPLRVFIGYDSREPVAYHVLAHSIIRHSSRPVPIIPLALSNLKGIYWRLRTGIESTEFSMTRFLVPFLSNYEGYSVFMDSDMLCQVDWCELSEHLRKLPENWAVACVQHDYVPKSSVKMDGQIQTAYPKKNWSSFMVFDNARCKKLTLEYVNNASGLDLHRFNWLEGDHQIAALSREWNWLVDEYEPNAQAKILHYTEGGPWFAEKRDCDHADLWLAEYDRINSSLVPKDQNALV